MRPMPLRSPFQSPCVIRPAYLGYSVSMWLRPFTGACATSMAKGKWHPCQSAVCDSQLKMEFISFTYNCRVLAAPLAFAITSFWTQCALVVDCLQTSYMQVYAQYTYQQILM